MHCLLWSFSGRCCDVRGVHLHIIINSLKSGCGFYIKGNIKFKPRYDLSINYVDDKNEFQSCWIEILRGNNPNILIVVFHRHPKKTSGNTFLEQLKGSLSKIESRNKHIILC